MSKYEIHQMDCLDGLRKVPNNEVDIVVTSPPYNIAKDYNYYEDSMAEGDYFQFLEEVFDSIYRCLDNDGSFFFNYGVKPSEQDKLFRLMNNIDHDFHVQNTIHWIKHITVPEEDVNIGHYKPVNSPRYLNQCHEYILHFTKSGDVELDKEGVGVAYKDKSNVGRYSDEDKRGRGNTWFVPYHTINSSRNHPAPFPVDLPKMCIRLHGYDEDTLVMDPFIGSGTTALASKELGCKCLGFEIDGKYVKQVRNKLQEAT